MIEAIITLVVFSGVVSYVVDPVLKRSGHFKRLMENTELRNLEQEKFNIYVQIKEADFEYEMGKLSYRDYRAQRQELMQKAVEILQELESAEGGTSRKGGNDMRSGSRCPECHTALPKHAKYCVSCGTDLTQKNQCSQCQQPIPPQANYCGHCGHEFAAA